MRSRFIAAAAAASVVAATLGLTAAPSLAVTNSCYTGANPNATCTSTSDNGTVAIAAATTSLSGTRVLTSLGAPVSTAATTKITDTYTTAVTETSAAGVNGWEVDEQLICNTGDANCVPWGTTPTGAQHNPSLVAGTNVIPATAVSESGGTGFSQTAIGGGALTGGNAGTDAAGTGGALNNKVRVYANTGEVTTNSYTAVHNATANLTVTPPNGTPQGAYTGTVLVTLWQ